MTLSASLPPAGLIEGRYRLENELGRGGMARVYRVHEESTGSRFALKKLVAANDQTLRAMFEREFHTLTQLAHPNIVRVFDYGLDGDDPYYTMELLDGCDAREAIKRSSLSVREICCLLRDCASALGLIHSRRMVHRDIGPRNVWRTTEGRAKLIDFGTLVAMGPQSRIAGTPPFIPPEAMNAQPLDARSDLYALGALGYFLATQQNAYPARSLSELPEYWQRKPKRPEAINTDVPGALSDLIMALLSPDARARPASAAEVYERLSAIGQLPIEDQREAAQAFLTSPTLVGRSHESGEVAKRLRRLLSGRGTSIAIVSPSGGGKTRMLAHAVLQAKVAGATTVSVDATAVGSGSLSLATRLAERLIEASPMLPAQVTDLAPMLGQLSPALHKAFGAPALAELSPLERTSKLSATVVRLFQRACTQHRLIAAIDDVHRADSASLGVLGHLALLASEHKLLLIVTCDADVLVQPPPALEKLVESHRTVLAPLTAAQTHELLEALFGAIPGLDHAAAWLYELSAGNPHACMQYAQYLVDERIARFERGHWILPLQLRDHGVPATLEALLERRISALSGDARELALGLALARDESRSSWQPEMHVRLEDFPKLLECGDVGRASCALDELLRAGVLQQRDACYVPVQRVFVDALVRSMPSASRKQSHGRLAEIFSGPAYKASWIAIREMLAAGDHAGARRTIVNFAASAAGRMPDWGAMRVSLQAQCSREAVDHWQAQHGSPTEGIILRRVLLTAATVYDWRLARSYGDAQLAQLHADCGWKYWSQTPPELASVQRIGACLTRAQQEYDKIPEAQRGLSPIDALRELAANSMLLNRSYKSSFDIARVRDLQPVLEALRPLSAGLALVADWCKLSVDQATGRECAEATLQAVRRMLDFTELPELTRRASGGLMMHEQALDDARTGRKRALQLLDVIASGGALDELYIVLHGRWLAHAFLGDAKHAGSLRKRAEIITEDDVWRHKAYLFVEAEYYTVTSNLQALSRIATLLSQLADLFEGWRPWLSYARAGVHRLRGEQGSAKTELEAGLLLAPAGEHRAWLALAPAYAEVLLCSGDAQAAERHAREMMERVPALGLQHSAAVSAARVLALALSKQQQHEAAQQTLEEALARARQLEYGGLPLAKLYEARAMVSLAAGNAAECVSALAELWPLIEHSEAQALLASYEALRQESAKQNSDAALPMASGAGITASLESSTLYTEVRTLFTSIDRAMDRAQQALKLLLEDTEARAGHILLLREEGLVLAGGLGDTPLSIQVLQQAQLYLNTQLAAVTTITKSQGEQERQVVTHGDLRLVPVLLTDNSEATRKVVGLALLAMNDEETRVPRGELVRVISQCLLAAGDAVAVSFDD